MQDYKFNPFVYVGHLFYGANRQNENNLDQTNNQTNLQDDANNQENIQVNVVNTNNNGENIQNINNNDRIINDNGTPNNNIHINLSINQNNNGNEKNAIIYCRLSKPNKKNVLSGNNNEKSLESQENECVKFCKNNNLRIKEVVCEICSAYNKKNKQNKLENILNNITSNDILIVWEISRFTRNIIDGTRRINIIRSKNAGIYIVNDRCGYPMTCEYPDIIRRIIYAQQESDIISERIKRSIKTKREKGSYIGSFAPYGKKIIRDNNNISRLENNDDEQFVIKKIMDLYDDGKNYEDILKFLKESNILKRNKQWKINSIKKIIRDNMRKFNMSKITNTLMEIDGTNLSIRKKKTKKTSKKRKNINDMECDGDNVYRYTKSKKIKIEKMDCDNNKTTQVFISDRTTIVSNKLDSNENDIKIHCLRSKSKK